MQTLIFFSALRLYIYVFDDLGFRVKLLLLVLYAVLIGLFTAAYVRLLFANTYLLI